MRTQDTHTRKELVERDRQMHHRALEALRTEGCELSGLQIWRKLVNLERVVRACATAHCNGETIVAHWPHIRHSMFEFDCSEKAQEYVESITKDAIRQIFGAVPEGFFVNWDARGNALKIDGEKVGLPPGMERDWGNNGILAAQIN